MAHNPPSQTARQWAVLLTLVVLASACPGGRVSDDGPWLSQLELKPTSVGQGYEVVFTVAGGKPPLHYTLTPPPGFSFYTGEGRLVGPASEPGDFNLVVHVRDVEGDEDTATFPLKVFPRLEALDTKVTQPRAGSTFRHAFKATGGKPPYRWSLVSGALPSGVSLVSSGDLTGQTNAPGVYALTLRLEDSTGAKVEVPTELEVFRADGRPSFPLAVGNWNVEWFGDSTNGPTNEALQLTNARNVLADADIDLWGLVEMVGTTHFNNLKADLPGYDGFLADNTQVVNGSKYYSSTGQKVGVLFKSNTVQVLRAELILTSDSYLFAGRPPLRLDLRIKRRDTTVDMTAIVLHMKAATSYADYSRRAGASAALKQYLDTSLPTQRVIVLGDWNDDVDASIVFNPESAQPYASPYIDFVTDTDDYLFTTQALSNAGISSTASHSDFIDHQLITHELEADYIAGSTQLIKPTIPSYETNTSDHFPVVSRFDLTGP